MKKNFPKYPQGSVVLIEDKLTKEEKKILDNFIVYCGGTAGPSKLRNIKTKILQIRDVSEIPYNKWDLDGLRRFNEVLNKSSIAPATKNDIRRVLKRFLKEYYDDWNKRFKGLKDIKNEYEVNQKRINANTIFTTEELNKIIRGADTLKLKALIMLMYESGGRPDEILSLKWEDIDLGKGEVKLTSTKNKKVRVNAIDKSILHLKRYKQEYPFDDVTPKDYVFPQKVDRKIPLSGNYFNHLFKRITKRTIGRDSFPYIIRHTRATELQKKLPAKLYEKFMDHSIKTASRYSHLNKDDVREAMLKNVYNIKEITEENKEELKRLNELVKLMASSLELLPLESLKKMKPEDAVLFANNILKIKKNLNILAKQRG